jgi:hypothetical protein
MPKKPLYQPHFDATANALFWVTGDQDPRRLVVEPRNVFVCGGLQNPGKIAGLVGRPLSLAAALAPGYVHKTVNVGGKLVPFMMPGDPKAMLPGVVHFGLSVAEFAAVEQFELAGGLRRRLDLKVLVGKHPTKVITFVKK